MKNQISQIGKRLNKKQLRSIAGGMLNCMEPILCPPYPEPCPPREGVDACTTISPACAQKICRPQL